MTRRCKSQKMTPRWTWFLTFSLFSRWKEVSWAPWQPSTRNRLCTARQQRLVLHSKAQIFFNSQWHRKIENAGQRWTKEYAWISIRKKREPKIQVTKSFKFWRFVKFVRLCDSLQFGSHFVISGHPPGTSQHFHSQGLMCLCSPCGRDNRCFTKKNRRERKKHAMQICNANNSNMQ